MLAKIILSAVVLYSISQGVPSGASIALIYFPRSQFSLFARTLNQYRDHLHREQGVLEVLTYRVKKYVGNEWDSNFAMAAVSFPTKEQAVDWLSTDPTIQSMNEDWANYQNVEIIVMETTMDRYLPLSTGYKAHIFGTSILKPAIFRQLFSQFMKVYVSHGGREDAAVIYPTGWVRFSGNKLWPPEGASLFMGPMPDMDTIHGMLTADNLQIPDPISLAGVNVYAVEAFFNMAATKHQVSYLAVVMFSLLSKVIIL